MNEPGVVNKSVDQFYSDAEQYWSEVPATVDGMLGGFGFISQTDIHGSRMFLKQLFQSKYQPERKYALDCGAGIGRISKNLLAVLFEKVDLVEQNQTFLESAKKYLGPKLMQKIGNFYSVGLQNFEPEKEKYDIIWIQWVLGHLTDSHLINFLKSCQTGLKPNGLIVVKENITSGEIEVDERDSSMTRPIGEFRRLFSLAGLDCYKQLKQHNFPKGLYTVFMFALKPTKITQEISTPMNVEVTLNVESLPDSCEEKCMENEDIYDDEQHATTDVICNDKLITINEQMTTTCTDLFDENEYT